MDDLISLLGSSAILPLVIASSLILLERFWQIPERLHPILFIRLLAVRTAKQNTTKRQPSALQNELSGILAMLLLTVPWLVILYFMNQFAYYPIFFDACLLLISLQFSHSIKRYQRIQRALSLNKKQLARDLLSKMVLRETASLSTIGIVKGSAESLLLRFYYQQLTVVFWFVIAGPYFALFYRMLLELNYVWNTKQDSQKTFGKGAYIACHWIQWIPVRLAAGLAIMVTSGISIFKRFKLKGFSQVLFSSNGALVLSAQALAMQLHLSGTVIYEGKKVRRQKFKGIREPDIEDMPIALSSLNRTLIVFLAVLLVIASVVNTLL